MDRRQLLTGASAVALAGHGAWAQPSTISPPDGLQPIRPGPVPLGGPSLDLNFINGLAIDSRISFTRASSASYFDSSGTLQTASSNVSRLDYGSGGGAIPKGLLIEEQRINSIRNPRAEGATAGILPASGGVLPTDWLQGATTNIVITIVGTGTESGIPYIDFAIVASGAGATRIQFENPAPTWSGSTAYATSVYARLISGSFTGFSAFNLQTFVLPSAAATTTSMLGITTAGLATQRFSTTGVSGSSDTSVRPEFACSSTGAGSVTVRIGAPQLEAGAFATSLILPVVGTPAATTRAGDVATVAVSNLATGTLVVEALQPVACGKAVTLAAFTGPSGKTGLTVNASNQVAMFDTTGGLNTSLGSEPIASVFKAGFAWAAGSQRGCINAGTITSATASSLTTGATALGVGYDGTSQQPNADIRRIRYWPRTLTSGELQQVTT